MVEPKTPRTVEHNNYLTAREAADLVSYAPDYITRLAREGKVAATRSGRQWLIEPHSLQHFVAETELQKERRREQLRAERQLERTPAVAPTPYAMELPDWRDEGRATVARVQALLVTCSVVVLIFVGRYGAPVSVDVQTASLGEWFTNLIVDERLVEQTRVVDGADAARARSMPQVERTTGELTVQEAERDDIAGLFSDEVQVTFFDASQGTVTPQFRSVTGTPRGFIVAPSP